MDQTEWTALSAEQQRSIYMETWSRSAMAELRSASLEADLAQARHDRDIAEDAVVSYVRPCPHCHEHLGSRDDCTCVEAFDKIVVVLDRWSQEHGEPLG